MHLVSGVLAGLGAIGVGAGMLLGFVTLLVLPWWAIFDCLFSRRSGGVKAAGVILLLITWGVGSFFYGLFVTTSKALRVVTILAFGGVFVLFAVGGFSMLAGAGVHAKVQSEEDHRERQEIAAQFAPKAVPAGQIAAYRGLHFTYTVYGPKTAALARFTGDGPDFGSARDTDRDVRQAACDPTGAQCWGLTSQDFGSLDTSSGRFTKIPVDPSLTDFSWPRGLAYDAKERKVFIMTSGVFTRFYRFDPATRAWDLLPAQPRDLSVIGLTWSASDGCLYALEHETHDLAIRRLQRFNTSGASLGPIDLRPVVPIASGTEDRFQVIASGDKLVLLLPPQASMPQTAGMVVEGTSSANRSFVVDPRTGEVFVPDAAR